MSVVGQTILDHNRRNTLGLQPLGYVEALLADADCAIAAAGEDYDTLARILFLVGLVDVEDGLRSLVEEVLLV